MITLNLQADEFLVDKLELTVYNFYFKKKLDKIPEEVVEFFNDYEFRVLARYKRSLKFKHSSYSDFRGVGWIRLMDNNEGLSLRLEIKINPINIVKGYIKYFNKELKWHKSYDGNLNYLPIEVYEEYCKKDINERILLLLNIEIVEYVYSFINDFSYMLKIDKESIASPRISIKNVEITWDQVMESPFQAIDYISENLKTKLQKYTNPQYSITDHVKRRTINSKMISGEIYKGEVQKVYVKSDKLLRFETTFSKDRIRTLLGTNVVKFPGKDLIETLKKLSMVSATFFNQFSVNDFEKLSIEEVKIRQLVLRSNDIHSMCEVIDILINNNCIQSQKKFRTHIYKLHKHNVIIKVKKGFYYLNPNCKEIIIRIKQILFENIYSNV